MAETIAGVTIPDSGMCRETTDFICDTESPLLYHHSRRTYLFGMLHGQLRGQHADPELLYVAAMFHDLGLVEGHCNLEQRFEVDGADAARRLPRISRGPRRRHPPGLVAIALHTTHGIPVFMEPEIALLAAGVETDVDGAGLDLLDPAAHQGGRRGPSAHGLQAQVAADLRRGVQAAPRHDVRRDHRGRARALRPRLQAQGLRRGRAEQRAGRSDAADDPDRHCAGAACARRRQCHRRPRPRARAVSRTGVASLWLGQLFDIDAITAVAAIAREVPDVELGTAVTITYPRHPIVMSSQAQTAQAAARWPAPARARGVAP